MKISASFLSMDGNIREKLHILDQCSIDYLHIDVMDGIFVPNRTFTVTEMRELVAGLTKPLDVHLMVSDVKTYIDQYKELNPEYITVHYEALQDEMAVITYIQNLGMKAGISLKPNTKVEEIFHLLPFVDLVLVMSVEPGKGGQQFLSSAIDKVNQLQNVRDHYDYTYLVEVDGGINSETIQYIGNADIGVAGNFITSVDPFEYETRVQALRNNL